MRQMNVNLPFSVPPHAPISYLLNKWTNEVLPILQKAPIVIIIIIQIPTQGFPTVHVFRAFVERQAIQAQV